MSGLETKRKGRGIRAGKERILLVDDEAVVREVSREMLQAMGYQVLTAGDGDDAIRIFGEHAHRIDLVLLDLFMPRMGGEEVFERLKRINPDVKVLLSSGSSFCGKTGKILGRGCQGFIQKPFMVEELSVKMREIFDRATGGGGIPVAASPVDRGWAEMRERG